jgi:hypothetical protein
MAVMHLSATIQVFVICLLIFISFCFNCCAGSTLWYLQKLLQRIVLEFTASIILYPLSPEEKLLTSGFDDSFSYMFILGNYYNFEIM